MVHFKWPKIFQQRNQSSVGACKANPKMFGNGLLLVLRRVLGGGGWELAWRSKLELITLDTTVKAHLLVSWPGWKAAPDGG